MNWSRRMLQSDIFNLKKYINDKNMEKVKKTENEKGNNLIRDCCRCDNLKQRDF